jgi:hypothetical protein
MAELTFAEISKLLKYDPETGKLFWLPRTAEMFSGAGFYGGAETKAKTWNARYAGTEAFAGEHPNGYKCGAVLGRGYLTHRIIWLFEKGAWPKDQIDHINGDRTDNRIENLREVSNAENARNMSVSVRNKSGIAGVFWNAKRQKWVANIGKNSRTKHLGCFDDFDLAVQAREKALVDMGYHINQRRTS